VPPLVGDRRQRELGGEVLEQRQLGSQQGAAATTGPGRGPDSASSIRTHGYSAVRVRATPRVGRPQAWQRPVGTAPAASSAWAGATVAAANPLGGRARRRVAGSHASAGGGADPSRRPKPLTRRHS
jgi:hypothetical protein